MLTAHQTIALAVLAVTVAGVLAGGYGYARRRPPGLLATQLLALGQTVLIAQVAVGLLLLSDDRRTADDLHYLYGFLSLGAALAPWLYAPSEPRRRLAWFVGATLVAGALAVRAYMTA